MNDALLRQSLRTRCTDIIRIQHLEHVGSGVTHQGTDAHDRQCDYRKHQMPCHIQNLLSGREALIVTSDNTVEVEPAKLYGKDPF